MSALISLFGTVLDDLNHDRWPLRAFSPVRADRRAVVGDSEEEPGNVGLLLKEGKRETSHRDNG